MENRNDIYNLKAVYDSLDGLGYTFLYENDYPLNFKEVVESIVTTLRLSGYYVDLKFEEGGATIKVD